MAEEIRIKFVLEGGEVKQILSETGDEITKIGAKAESSGGALSKLGDAFTGLNQGLELAKKGLAFVGEGFGLIADALDQGNKILDLEAGFAQLAATTGATTADLQAFSDAMGGTLTKAEELAVVNKGLAAGLDPKSFDDIAKAARSYADTVGGDAKTSLDTFIQTLAKGDDRALKSIGIIVDNNKAIADYAAANGVAADTLNELGKAEAIRIAATEALVQKTAELGAVTNDSKDNLDQFQNTITNTIGDFQKAVASNTELNAALQTLTQVIKDTDFTPLINGITSIITAFAEFAAGAVPAVIQGIQDVQRGFSVLGEIASQVANFELPDLGKAGQAVAINESAAAAQQLVESFKKVEEAAAAVPAAAPEIKKLTSNIVDQGAAAKKAADGIKKSEDAIKKKADADKKAAAEAEKHNQKLIAQGREVLKIVQSTKAYEEIQKKVAAGTLTAAEAASKIAKFYDEIAVKSKLAADKQQELDAALLKAGNGATDQAAKIATLSQEITGLEASMAKTGEVSTGFLDDFLKGTFGEFGDVGTGFGEAIGGQLQSAVSGIFQTLTSEGSTEDKARAVGAAIGGLIGTGLGLYFSGGNPVAGAVAGGIGALLGDLVGGLFGKEGKGTAARKKADAYFADLFQAERLGVIINGQLVKIKDLVFQGNTLFNGTAQFGAEGITNSFSNFFQTLPAEAQASFGAVGLAFEQLLGVGEDIAGQLGAVFANNIGGDLNNLQLLVQATGKSFDEMKQSVVDAFLDANIGAAQAQGAINSLQQIFQSGIPGAVGATQQAMDNLIASAATGRASVDALGDLGAEGIEAGISSLEQLRASLAATGKFSAADIEKLFGAISQAGIGSLEALRDISAEAAIGLLSNLQAAGFQFADAATTAEALTDKINAIPENQEKNLTFNVKTNVDSATQEAAANGTFRQGYGTDFPVGVGNP